MRSFKLALSTIWFLSLAACSLPTPEKRSGQNVGGALFYVDKVEGKPVRGLIDQQTSMSIGGTVSVVACVKDYKLQKPIQNHRYQVLRENEVIQELTSDANGCLEWTETVHSNPSSQKSYIEFLRVLRGVGVYKGDQQIRFYVNNEDGSVKSGQTATVADAVPEAQTTAAPSDTSVAQQARLWIEDLRLAVEEKNNIGGTLFNFKARTLAQIDRKKMNGETVLDTLNYGTFKVRGQLLHIYPFNGKEVRRPLSGKVEVTSEVVKGSMYIELPIKVDLICTKGQVQLALEVEPTNSSISRFEGVFIIADCDAIKGNFFSRLENQAAVKNGQFKIADYLTTTGTPSATEMQDFYQPARIEIKRLTFSDVGFVGQKSLERERKFQVGACLKTGLDQKAAKAQTLKITRANGTKTEARTNDDGCAFWDDSITFQYLSQECWVDRSVTIENTNLGIKETIALSINPWANNEAFARDKRFIDANAQINQCATGEAEFVMQSYSFDKKTYQIKMDEFMNIRLEKTGNFQLNFAIKRPSLTEATGYSIEQAPPGDYLLRLAVVDISADDLKDFKTKVFQVSEHVVHSQGAGIIVHPLMLSTSNIRAVGNTNTLLIQLLPLTPEKAALAKQGKEDLVTFVDPAFRNRSMVFKGPIMIANNKEGNALEPVQLAQNRDLLTQLMIQKDYDDSKYKQLMTVLAKKETLAKEQDLRTVNLNNAQETQSLLQSMNTPPGFKLSDDTKYVSTVAKSTLQDLQIALNGASLDKTTAERLCMAWFYDFYFRKNTRTGHSPLLNENSAPNALATSCVQTVRQLGINRFFSVEFRHIVKNPVLKSIDQTLVKDVTIASSFSMNRTYTEAVSHSVSMDASVGLKVPGLSILNVGTGARLAISKSWSNSENHAASNQFSSGIALFLENIRMTIQPQTTEKCAIIRLNPNLFVGDSWIPTALDKRLTAEEKGTLFRKGLLLCEGTQRVRKGTLAENIYVLNQKTVAGQVVDTMSDLGRPFFAVLRGTSDLHSFMSFLQGTYDLPQAANGQEQATEATNKRLERAFLKATPVYPGHYVIGQ